MDTFTLADGTIIDKSTGERIRPKNETEKALLTVQKNQSAEFSVLTRRYIDELPGDPKIVNPVAVYLMYRLFGLNDDDIAYLLNIPVERLAQLANNSVYTKLQDAVLTNVREFDTDLVRKELNRNAVLASQTLSSVLTDKEATPGERIKAADSILDRTGNRPADVIEHRHRVEGGLNIRIIKDVVEENLPIINLEAAE